jgi:hypothetical protein
VGGSAKVVTVPVSAVIDSGTRQVVLIQKAAGRFEPREVKLGARSDDHVEVREGIAEGDMVVVAANFLIDAESNLKAALSGLTPADAAPAPRRPRARSATRRAGTLRSHRPERRRRHHDPRPGRQPQVAGDDHGLSSWPTRRWWTRSRPARRSTSRTPHPSSSTQARRVGDHRSSTRRAK